MRVVLDTNVVVSALLVPSGTQAAVLQSRQIDATLAVIRKAGRLIEPSQTLSISTHESDNRFLECVEAAEADYLVTGNTRHFPRIYKTTKIVTGRRFFGYPYRIGDEIGSLQSADASQTTASTRRFLKCAVS